MTPCLRVIADSHIPGLEPLEQHPRVELLRLDAADITPAAVRDADALLVRTRTRCDSSLLASSRVRFAGTATIGTDHIDTSWCAANGIETCSAPGCNAPAVAQYVLTSLLTIHGDRLPGMTLGIVGVGHVGGIVARWARGLGMRVLECDPPRAEAEGTGHFVSLGTIAAESDIITMHTPLTRSGAWPTHHMAGDTLLRRVRRGITFVNAARGAVIETPALLRAIDDGTVAHAVIDTWEGEPDSINLRLLEAADIATPHIAGYSAAGKQRATQMVLAALYRRFGLGAAPCDPALDNIPDTVTPRQLTDSLDPTADTRRLKASPGSFEALRNGYDLRPEP